MTRLLYTAAVLLAVLAALLLGVYIEFSTGAPIATGFPAEPPAPPIAIPSAPPPARPPATNLPEAPSAQTPDLQRCYATMIGRKLTDADARITCAKLIGGISH